MSDDPIHLALQHHRAGRLAQAEQIYRQMLATDPRNHRALYLLGILARQANHPDDAVQLISRAIELDPNVPEYHAELGETWIIANQPDRALPSIRRAIELNPRIPAYNNLGHALLALGRIDEAIDAFTRGAQLHPDDFIALSNLGAACSMAGRPADAIVALRRAIQINPDDVDSLCNLAIVLRSAAQLDDALNAAQRAVDLAPGSSEALNTLGDVLLARNESKRAAETLRKALELSPRDPVILSNLAIARQRLGHLDAAVATFRQAIAANPGFPEAHHNLGISLRTLGQLDEAEQEFRHALKLKPAYVAAHDSLLLTTLYRETDPGKLAEAHRLWERQHTSSFSRERRAGGGEGFVSYPHRPLRIGYVSPDFRDHPIAFFIGPLLAAHDRSEVEVFCYADVGHPDGVTSRLQSLAHHWRAVLGLTDDGLAAMIRGDRIDILVDLALHSGNNRLLVFARKPAPIQISYLGYCFSPGLGAIDYRFTDPLVDPPSAPNLFPEQPWRLPETFCCYQPPPDAPEVSEQPALAGNPVTFGSFNNLAKITDHTLKLWSRLLGAIPTSRLLIQAQGADQPSVAARLQNLFPPGRLTLRSAQPMTDYLQSLSSVDVALDTFPFNGHTTTCHAAWMGVPTISRAGDLPLSRVGASILTNLRLSELLAASDDDYIESARRLASDLQRLVALRRSLRDRMRASPLTNAKDLARHVEQAYRKMWHPRSSPP